MEHRIIIGSVLLFSSGVCFGMGLILESLSSIIGGILFLLLTYGVATLSEMSKESW